MTTDQMQTAKLGKEYWHQYVKLNGYAFQPKRDGLVVLSRNLDLNFKHLSRCITAYLAA